MLTPMERQQLDEACDEFESQWHAQGWPQATVFLDQTEGPLRSVLLHELLKIETHWRGRAADFAELRSKLLKRYPSLRETVESILGAGSSRRSLARSGDALGPFHQLQKIGDGGFGLVFRAWDTRHQRRVALKIPRLTHQLVGDDLDAFFREAKAAGSLDHPNIARVWDSGTTDGVTYIAYQLVDGDNLKLRMDEFTQKSSLEIIDFALQLCSAVQYAHEAGIVHRDIKPSNVLITADNQPVLTDFGLALAIGGDATRSLAARIGTLDYMSPEQATGRQQEIDERSDIWSLGVVLYELLTGKLPFSGASELELCNNICEASYKQPRQLRREVPKDLEVVLERCLQKRPKDRLSSCAELVGELTRIASGRPIQSRPVNFVEKSIRWCQRNPRPIVAFGAILVATVFGAWSWGMRRAENRQNENVVQQLQMDLEVKSAERRVLLIQLLNTDLRMVELQDDDLQFLLETMLQSTVKDVRICCAEILARHQWLTADRFPEDSAAREQVVEILQELRAGSELIEVQSIATNVIDTLAASK